MREITPNLCLVIIFILHNYEELHGFELFKKVYAKFSNGLLGDYDIFRYAIIFLNTMVILLSIAEYIVENHVTKIIFIVLVFSILINAVQHIVLSVRYQKMLPGIYTSIILIIPYFVLLILTSSVYMTLLRQNFLEILIFSLLTISVSPYLSLAIGYLSKQCFKILRK